MARKAKKALLGGAAVDGDNLRVNETYAARFEHNNKRRDLHRLQEKHAALAAKYELEAVSGNVPASVSVSDDDDVTSSDEDENPSDEINGQFLEALLKIRNRDATIYDKDAVLFSEGVEDGVEPRVKKQKPIYLRQVIAEQALREAADIAGDAEVLPVTYLEEQNELKRDFLQAAEDMEFEEADDSIGGVMQASPRDGTGAPPLNEELLEKLFGKASTDEGDNFLKNYITRQAWDEDAEENEVPHHAKVAEALAEDEDYLQRADTFEASYNFRFQEDDAAQIVTYPREVEGVVRKTDDRRKVARKRKAERLEGLAHERVAEMKRLKNLKRAEVDERMAEIQRISGHQGNTGLSALLDGDFEPEAHDAAMAAAFDADYYQGEDEHDAVMDESLARELAEIVDDVDITDALCLTHRNVADVTAQGGGAGDAAAGREQGQQLLEEKARVQKLIDEYFKLDFESTVGGMPCRFRYKEVPAASYGLDVLEILGIDNKDLNQVVSMKKLAPYREDAGMARPNYAKVRELKNKLHEEQAANRRPKAAAKRKRGSDAAALAAYHDRPAVALEQKSEKGQRGLHTAEGAFALPAPVEETGPASIKMLAGPHNIRTPSKQAWQREKRLETFAPLTLRKAVSATKRPKEKEVSSATAALQSDSAPSAARLTKAQKKNLKRSLKRKGGGA